MLVRGHVRPTQLAKIVILAAVFTLGLGIAGGRAAGAVDMFEQLRTFTGTVLVPPAGLQPFDELSPYRVEIGRPRGSATSRGRYVVQYRPSEARGLNSGEAQLGGAVGRDDFDDTVRALANLSFRRCDADAPYCAENVGGQDDTPPASELFRDLTIGDGPAVVEHVTCCGGHYWTLTWFDAARDMTYELVVVGALADEYGRQITQDNLPAARRLAELASRLEPLR